MTNILKSINGWLDKLLIESFNNGFRLVMSLTSSPTIISYIYFFFSSAFVIVYIQINLIFLFLILTCWLQFIIINSLMSMENNNKAFYLMYACWYTTLCLSIDIYDEGVTYVYFIQMNLISFYLFLFMIIYINVCTFDNLIEF